MAGGSSSYTLNIKALFDASSVKAGVSEIQNSLKSLKLPDKLATDLNSSFANVNKALDDFTSKVEKGIKTKSDAGGITKSFENVTRELTKLDNLMIKVKGQLGEGVDLSKIIKLDDKTLQELNAIEAKIKSLQSELATINTNKLSQLQELLGKIKQGSGAAKQGEAALKLFEEGDVQSAINTLDKIINKLEAYKRAHTDAKTGVADVDLTNVQNSLTQLEAMRTTMTGALDQSKEKIQEIGNLSEQAAQKTAQAYGEVKGKIDDASGSLNNYKDKAIDASQAVTDLTSRQAQFVREVDQIKSRIQYFFGLANAINLVKRAVRGAVDTIKELDKAMTETAVVTDYTVKDMWSQLPEYTKRANELGVTTKDAYESATLYFQQGLNAEQAAALSTETLKMARIAGLDAAEATDRMTNALRGFNMALDEQSAQRVDDVYSQLAAHTASNVDEISTAMTKVASLAHNANMEFETTAAFLAQIIETTRESAETAGTALKTVVARFSEVKKLVDEGTLRGTDEEGQAIDVNKVGAALRTAGIDLNKYFLGEVGLDDIFIELASKWDTLTAVQQRYIATQAAGSRQQSRFIALMQDYARTQELVGMAYEAEGASQKQFEKTQDSLQSKLARLKNAWNEFLMGITNNVMVKTVVDILTGILNFVNKLTSAFGDGAGAVLKFVTAFGGLMGMRSLFVNGGIATRVIGAFLGSGIIGQKFGVSAGLGRMVAQEGGGQIYQAFTGQELRQQRRGVNIFGNIGNIGKGIWGKAKDLGAFMGFGNKGALMGGLAGSQLTGSAGLAAGLGGLVTALGVIAAAALAAYGVYKLWEKISPEGQLKKAQKEAEKLKKISEEADKELKSKQNLQDIYKEQTEKVENATTAADRQAAIQARNEAILSAIEEDGTLAQYVITERTDFGIELTVNEEALSNAIEAATEKAQEAAIDVGFANAQVSKSKSDVARATLEGIYRHTVDTGITYKELQAIDVHELYSEIIASGVGSKLTEEATTAYQSYLSSLGGSQKQAEIAYGQQLSWAGASKELTNALIPILGEAFMQTGKQLSLSEIESLLKQDESTITAIAEAFNGTSSFYNENLIGATSINFGFAADELEAFAAVIGLSREEVEKQIKAQVELAKKVQKQKKSDIYNAALTNGVPVTLDFFKTVQNLSPKIAETISSIIATASDSLSQEGMAQLIPQLLGMDEENLAQFSNFFANFDLNDPINAFHQLNQAKQEALSLPDDNPYRQMLDNIEQANSSIFDTGNLVQTFLTSMSYDGLTSSVQDFIKANGKLTADNIEELASGCADLQNLLEDTTATAQGLAAAFSLFENGEAPIDAITSSLLAALSAGEDFETLMSNVSKWIQDFDEGTDMKEGTEHILDLAEKATDYIYKWEFGNEPLANIYDHIFGEGAYNKYMQENWGKTPIEQIEQKLQGDIDRVKALAENEGKGALDALIGKTKGQITESNGYYTWDLTQYDSASEAIQDVSKNLGVAEDAARAFIEAWGSHMWDMGQSWDELNFNDKIKAFSDDLGKNNVITQQELDALAANTGKSAEEIINSVNKLREQTGEPVVITVDWTDGKGRSLSGTDLIDKVKNGLEQLGTSYSKLGDQFAKRKYIGSELTDLGIDYNNLSSYLTNSLKLNDSQAKEVANDIASQTGKQLTQEIQVPVKAADGSIEMMSKTITSGTVEGLEAAIESEQLKAKMQMFADALADIDFSSLGESLWDAMQRGVDGARNVDEAVEEIPKERQIEITYNEGPRPEPIPDQIVNVTYVEKGKGHYGKFATGGIIDSYAKGSENFHAKPGVALTGEEGPEIVWNKNQGYAYVTGSNGPEFQDLKPGDRVFNASETKRIFKNSSIANGGIVDSFASGGWNDRGDRNEGGGNNNNDKKTSAEWKNELDWLYNLMEDIVELERDQKDLEEQFQDVLSDETKTSKDLYNLLVQRLGNLNVQLDRQTLALQKREQEMREFMDTTNDQDEYLWYNWQDRTIEINWNGIDQITDGDLYKHVKELVSKAEEIQNKMDDAEDAITDIKNQIQELENVWRDTYVDFEKRVLEALIASYQEVIDNYSELNDALTENSQDILDAIQKELDLERQIRDNTQTEDDINKKQARLAYLKRDTTGANATEILKLQKEIEENQEDYQDNLIDQAIQRLQDDNDASAKQRDKQIEIMQAQLDYSKEVGEFNEQVTELISSALSPDGTLLTDSDLYKLLSKQENWSALSAVNKQIWEEELTSTFKEVGAYLLKDYAEWTGEFYTQVAEAINSISDSYTVTVGDYSQARAGGASGSGSGGGGGGSGNSGNGSNNNGNGGGGIGDKIAGIIKTGIEIASATAQGLINTNNEALNKSTDGATNAIKGGIDAVIKGAVTAAADAVQKGTDIAAGALDKNTKTASELIKTGIDTVTKNAAASLKETGAISGTVTKAASSAIEAATKTVTSSASVAKSAETAATAAKTTSETAVKGVEAAVKAGIAAVTAAKAAESTTKATTQAADLNKKTTEAASKAATTAAKAGADATKAAVTVAKATTDVAKNVTDTATKTKTTTTTPKKTTTTTIKKGGAINQKYATGGLNTQQGPAWLDGTLSEPEYVLNARQTQAFLKLADVLPNVMSGNSTTANAFGNNIYLNLDMHVDEIGSDYDVDRIADRVKDILYNASSYRNVNTINFIR